MVLTINSPPEDCTEAFSSLFSPAAVSFLESLLTEFQAEVSEVLRERKTTRDTFRQTDKLPEFFQSEARHDPAWKVSSLPPRLQTRHLEFGDVSPADTSKLMRCLEAREGVNSVQVDFDDGHCPSWKNQVRHHAHSCN